MTSSPSGALASNSIIFLSPGLAPLPKQICRYKHLCDKTIPLHIGDLSEDTTMAAVLSDQQPTTALSDDNTLQ